MTITMVGVFDDASDAREASSKLRQAGIAGDSISVHDSDRRTATSVPAEEHRPGGIRRFFAELFGSASDDDAGHYAEAVRRGSAVLTVHDVPEQRVDELKDVLEECGAIDIDQRVEQWRAGGWSGYDEHAPAMKREPTDTGRAGMQTLSVVEEQLKAGKREVQRGGVRLHRRVTERPVEEHVSLREERAVIDRHPVDRPATAADLSGGGRDKLSRSDVDVEPLSQGKRGSAQRAMEDDNVNASLRSYSGPERRRSMGSGYSGVERRTA